MVPTRRTDIHPPPVTAAWLVQSAGAESHTTYTGEVKQGRFVLCARQQLVGVAHTYLVSCSGYCNQLQAVPVTGCMPVTGTSQMPVAGCSRTQAIRRRGYWAPSHDLPVSGPRVTTKESCRLAVFELQLEFNS